MLLLSWLQYTAIFCSRNDSWIVLSTPDCLCGASEMCHAGMEYGVCRMGCSIGSQVQQGSKDKSKYTSSLDCARQLYRRGGITSLYQGTMATMLRGIYLLEAQLLFS